jgi:flagellar protein FlaG
VTVNQTSEYREQYANSVQIRASLWDFFLMFATALQTAPDAVTLNTFQGIYLSPQQGKALAALLNQHIAHYEQTFGEIKVEPMTAPPGAVQ